LACEKATKLKARAITPGIIAIHPIHGINARITASIPITRPATPRPCPAEVFCSSIFILLLLQSKDNKKMVNIHVSEIWKAEKN
jgi:hypothetical protein